MPSTIRPCLLVALATVLSAASSGCITVSANPAASFSLKNWRQAREQQAAIDQQFPMAPPEPKHPEEVQLAYARLMEENGRHSEARQQYAEVLKAKPKNVDALLGTARLNLAAGDSEAALASIQKAVKVAPESAPALAALGEYHAAQKNWPVAAETLNKAMLADPQNSQIRYSLAVALTHTGQVDAALPHFIRTVGDAEAHYNVGLILQSRGQLPEAERHFSIAVSKKPELHEARRWLAHLRGQPAGVSPPRNGAQPPEVLPAGYRAAQSAPPGDAPFVASR